MREKLEIEGKLWEIIQWSHEEQLEERKTSEGRRKKNEKFGQRGRRGKLEDFSKFERDGD